MSLVDLLKIVEWWPKASSKQRVSLLAISAIVLLGLVIWQPAQSYLNAKGTAAATITEQQSSQKLAPLKDASRKILLRGGVAFFSGKEARQHAYLKEELIVVFKLTGVAPYSKSFNQVQIWEHELVAPANAGARLLISATTVSREWQTLRDIEVELNGEGEIDVGVMHLYSMLQHERGLIHEATIARRFLNEEYACLKGGVSFGPQRYASCWQSPLGQKQYIRMLAGSDVIIDLLSTAVRLIDDRLARSNLDVYVSYRRERTIAQNMLAEMYVQSARACDAVPYYEALVAEINKKSTSGDLQAIEKDLSDSMKQCASDKDDYAERQKQCRAHTERFQALLAKVDVRKGETRHRYAQILGNELDCMYLVAGTQSLPRLKEHFAETNRLSEVKNFIKLADRIYSATLKAKRGGDHVVEALRYIEDRLGR